MTANTEQLTVN